VYAVLAVNLGITLLIVVTVAWTRFWRGLPEINVLDSKSAVLVAAAADREPTGLEIIGAWDGSAEDRLVGRLRVKLMGDCKRLAFVRQDP